MLKLFSVEPMKGVLAPDAEQRLAVSFNSTREVRLRDNKDIRCMIMEANTGEVFETFDVTVSVRSVFSKFRLHPQRGELRREGVTSPPGGRLFVALARAARRGDDFGHSQARVVGQQAENALTD